MRMPTIKDIAKAAGVSHGTVSNVLNGRGNVSVEKIKLVEETAQALGYKLNAKAKILRQGKSKTIAVLIPGIQFQQYAAIYQILEARLKAFDYKVQLYLTKSIESEEENCIDDALSSRVSAIVAVSCLKSANLKYCQEAHDIPVVFIDWLPSPEWDCSIFAGFDYKGVGSEIGGYLAEKNARNVAVLTSPQELTHMHQLQTGIETALYKKSTAVKFLPVPDYLASVQAFELFEQNTAYDYIICTDKFRQKAAASALSFSSFDSHPRFITICESEGITDCSQIAYELDYKTLGHKVSERLLEILEDGKEDYSDIVLKNSGFKNLSDSRSQTEETLRFLTVSSPASHALSCLLPHFKKKTGIHVELTVLGLEELYDVVTSMAHQEKYDLIRMDMAWISELAPKLYAPFSTLKLDFDSILHSILPDFLNDYTSVNHIRCCLPYDPSTQIMFYRKDLFEDAKIKRMYYEQNREELQVPATFEAYNKVARFFTRTYNPQSPVKFGSTVAIGNSVVTPSEYLPRLFGSGGALFDKNGKINLQTECAKKALLSYMETFEYSDKSIYQWWKSALEGFADGSAAMTIVFMNHASDIINSKISSIAGKIGFCTIPDSKPLIGGGVIGISRSCKNPDKAYEFLKWLYSDDIAPVFTMLGGLSPCKTVYNNCDVMELYPWLSAAKQSFPIGQRRINNNYYNNFSEITLEKIISTAVKNAIMGIMTVDEALKYAQNCCEETFITSAQ